MSYIVKQSVKLRSLSAIGKLVEFRQHLVVRVKGGGAIRELNHAAGKSEIARMLSEHTEFALRNVNTDLSFHVQWDGQQMSAEFDSDIQVHWRTHHLEDAHPIMFLFGRGDNVSDFYAQAQVMDQLEDQLVAFEVGSDYQNEQGMWMPGNIRVAVNEQLAAVMGGVS